MPASFSGLQALWTRFGDRGLTVIAVAVPRFRESGAPGRCRHRGGRAPQPRGDLPRHGQDACARAFRPPVLNRWAAAEKPGNTPNWNFHKYLVDREGNLIGAFPPNVEPNDPRIVTAIANALPAA